MTGRQMLQSMQGRPIRLMSAAVAGALTVAGFAPLGFSPLPVLALTLLFVLWNRAASAREAALKEVKERNKKLKEAKIAAQAPVSKGKAAPIKNKGGRPKGAKTKNRAN